MTSRRGSLWSFKPAAAEGSRALIRSAVVEHWHVRYIQATVLLAQADRGCHAALSRSIALRVVIIFRMTATMMTLDFLSASARRLWKVLRAGLYRLALRAAM